VATIDLTAEPTTLILQAGDDITIPLAEDPVNPDTWTGYANWFGEVRDYDESTVSHAIEIDTVSQADGIIRLVFSAAVTTAIRSGSKWQIQAHNADGDTVTLISGTIKMKADVARP
jgi:hypothetical protein